MTVFDLFSYRNRAAEGERPDVFVYDKLSQELRVQIVGIMRDALGRCYVGSAYEVGTQIANNEAWEYIHDTVAREHGVFKLADGIETDERCTNFLLTCDSVDRVLDLVEISFFYINRVAPNFSGGKRREAGIKVTASQASDELNKRFRRAGVGYQFEEGKIFRVDSELIHSDVVQPALRYLHQRGFEGPRDEFIRAHKHYRAGELQDAVTDANNAFESTLKTICDQRHWPYSKGARVSDLLKIVRANGLLPSYLDASFDQLTATLRSGLPEVRNEEGAHGQGATPRETPNYVAAYALHLAAANILFLAEAHKAKG